MKCDFCSDADPQVRYPVQVGTPWAACRECAALIDAGELLALVRRIITRLVTPKLRTVPQPPDLLEAMATELAHHVEALFWGQRDGPPEPIYGPQLHTGQWNPPSA